MSILGHLIQLRTLKVSFRRKMKIWLNTSAYVSLPPRFPSFFACSIKFAIRHSEFSSGLLTTTVELNLKPVPNNFYINTFNFIPVFDL